MTVFNYMVIHNLTRSIGTSLTYVPSSNSGSFRAAVIAAADFRGGSFGGGGGGRGRVADSTTISAAVELWRLPDVYIKVCLNSTL